MLVGLFLSSASRCFERNWIRGLPFFLASKQSRAESGIFSVSGLETFINILGSRCYTSGPGASSFFFFLSQAVRSTRLRTLYHGPSRFFPLGWTKCAAGFPSHVPRIAHVELPPRRNYSLLKLLVDVCPCLPSSSSPSPQGRYYSACCGVPRGSSHLPEMVGGATNRAPGPRPTFPRGRVLLPGLIAAI